MSMFTLAGSGFSFNFFDKCKNVFRVIYHVNNFSASRRSRDMKLCLYVRAPSQDRVVIQSPGLAV